MVTILAKYDGNKEISLNEWKQGEMSNVHLNNLMSSAVKLISFKFQSILILRRFGWITMTDCFRERCPVDGDLFQLENFGHFRAPLRWCV